MSKIDFDAGYRYANETLDKRAVNGLDLLVAGVKFEAWQRETAQHMIDVAQARKAEGINPSYQDGVIARAQGGL